jgi:hypothetical protein
MISFKEFLSEATNLGASELYKYEKRVALFLQKFKDEEPFQLVDGGEVVLKYDTEIEKAIKNKDNPGKIVFTSKDGDKTFKLTDLRKSKEFGGGVDRTKIEKNELDSLNNQIEIAKEDEGSDTINVKVGDNVYEVDKAEKTPGNPKSDFHLLDNQGKEVVWISHKDGTKASDFQQWGGISKRVEPILFAYDEVQDFVEDLKKKYPDGLPSATTLYRKIVKSELKMKSIYGNQYGDAPSRQNVSIVMQGPVKLIKKGKNYELSAHHVHLNGDDIEGAYEPVLMATYKGDRSNEGLKGTRLSISPFGSRKGKEFPKEEK